MMLQTIREHTQGWIAGTVISIIILTFALWGIHSYFVGGGANDIIATINGTDISKQAVNMAYERLRRQAQIQYHAALTSQEDAILKKQALGMLVDAEVLKQASEAEGFKVSNQQVDGFLQAMPEFQVDGQFSLERFQQVLSSAMLSTGEFLELIRTNLLIDQPKLGIILTAFALPEETNTTIALVNQERNIDYMIVPLSYFFPRITIAPQQVQNYYESHKNDFMTPEQMKVNYVALSLKNLATTIKPTEAELKNYYADTYQSSKTKKFSEVENQVKAAYIQQKAEEKFAELREELANLTYEHPDSLDFAVKKLNLPLQTSELFARDKEGKGIAQYKKVRDAAFSNDVLNLQNNSDIIQLNSDSVIVLRVNSHVPSTLSPLQTVSAQIIDALRKEKAETLAANFIADTLKQLESSSHAADQLTAHNHLTWTRLGFIGRYSNKVNPAILEAAFRAPASEANQPTSYTKARLADGYAIVALHGMRNGNITDKKASVFAEQMQNAQGMVEYELYKQSQIAAAKIKYSE